MKTAPETPRGFALCFDGPHQARRGGVHNRVNPLLARTEAQQDVRGASATNVDARSKLSRGTMRSRRHQRTIAKASTAPLTAATVMRRDPIGRTRGDQRLVAQIHGTFAKRFGRDRRGSKLARIIFGGDLGTHLNHWNGGGGIVCGNGPNHPNADGCAQGHKNRGTITTRARIFHRVCRIFAHLGHAAGRMSYAPHPRYPFRSEF